MRYLFLFEPNDFIISKLNSIYKKNKALKKINKCSNFIEFIYDNNFVFMDGHERDSEFLSLREGKLTFQLKILLSS